MKDALKKVVEADSRVGYALLFGSTARGTQHSHSDVDVALGPTADRPFSALELGEIASRLETAAGRAVDVVDLSTASPALAYRVFRDGQVILERDRERLVARQARAILEYLDFKPVEEECARGVLAAGRGG